MNLERFALRGEKNARRRRWFIGFLIMSFGFGLSSYVFSLSNVPMFLAPLLLGLALTAATMVFIIPSQLEKCKWYIVRSKNTGGFELISDGNKGVAFVKFLNRQVEQRRLRRYVVSVPASEVRAINGIKHDLELQRRYERLWMSERKLLISPDGLVKEDLSE